MRRNIIRAYFVLLLVLIFSSCAEIPSNQSPATPVIIASATEVSVNEEVNLFAVCSDPDNDSLSYSWSATGGSFDITSKDSVVWTSPDIEGEQTYTISVNVTDTHGASSSASINILVNKNGGGNSDTSYVEIGNDSIDLWAPFGGAAETYKITQLLYFNSEIGRTGKITGISTWATTSFEREFSDFKIYILQVNSDKLNDTLSVNYEGKSPILVLESSSLTYGYKDTDLRQWHDFDFSTPYDYDGNGNILIVFERGSTGGGGASVAVGGFKDEGHFRMLVVDNKTDTYGNVREQGMYIRFKFSE